MTIRTFEVVLADGQRGDVHKSHSIMSDDPFIYYLGKQGQGCSTVWFKSLKAAKMALQNDGVKTGMALADCSNCACHYSVFDHRHKGLEPNICSVAKTQYAIGFEG
ncbi:hypothetical protein JWZ98_22975 (plasmid) [Methylomonas sp. EFPC1]|uniref:hypothetical protein n=1 Tax=Methylomonas sp. EFPC1 TaxID=2812647 RepID=UPI0019681E71|nr:hypothetical protein [Methylomonas sp. EFPC1]QSB03777.1 hypothetical protein JWZ98_22975 [Methylomonas sp. EFPC1]